MHFLRQFIETLLYPLRALLDSPGKLSSSARRLAGISLAARITLLATLFEIFVVIAILVYRSSDPRAASWLFTLPQWFAIVGLMIMIPVLLYFVLRLWLEGEASRFPDIDHAWKAGLAELRTHGLDLEYTPLFLVLGSPGELQEINLFRATKLSFNVRNVPSGTAALHWYAEPSGIYLVCSNVGCLSKLAVEAKRAADEVRPRGGVTFEGRKVGNIRETMAPDEIKGTMVLPEGGAPAAAPAEKPGLLASQLMPMPAAESADRVELRGTVMMTGDDDSTAPREDLRRPITLSPEVQREQELRLEYLCRLIAKARQPLAPINGVLALLPYSVVQSGGRTGVELQRAVKRDSSTLVRSFRMRCPVTALVIGLEEESGFREIVRRLPREAAVNQRYGKGFSVGNPPISEQMEAVAAHACGLFEATTYQLFRERGSLGKPGNMKLYALLCKIRRSVRAPMTNLLMSGFGYDPDEKTAGDPEPLFFNGCYFAACGESDEHQAFIKCVVEKLPADQEELEWTEAALADDERYDRLATMAVWIDFLLLLGPLAMLVYHFWPE